MIREKRLVIAVHMLLLNSSQLCIFSLHDGKIRVFKPIPQRPKLPINKRINGEYKDEDTTEFQQDFSIDTDSVATTEDSEEDISSRQEEEPSRKLATSSRSIPIPYKSSSRKLNYGATYDYDNDESIKQAELHYELATWNMYDRIMEYREKHSFGLEYQHDSSPSTLWSQTTSTTTTTRRGRESSTNRQNPAVEYYEMDDDGIFDMEV